MSDELHEITEQEKAEWQRSKKQQRSSIVLSDEDTQKFVRFVAQNRPYGDFEIHFNTDKRDVDLMKHKMGIDTMEEAQDKLRSEFGQEERDREAHLAELRKQAKEDHAAAERRLTEQNNQAAQQSQNKVDNPPNSDMIKMDDAKRQRRLEASEKEAQVVASDEVWCLPEDEHPDRLLTALRGYGWQFTCAKYGVKKSQIMVELQRLGLDSQLNYDLIPR